MTEEQMELFAPAPAEVEENAPIKSWDEYIQDYLSVQEFGDRTQWTLGDIVNEVLRATKAKGSARMEMITKFAVDVGQRPETVRQYAWVSERFPRRSDRVTGLSWTHYRAAAKAKDKAMDWINEAVDNNWSVGRLIEEIKNVEDTTSIDEGRPCDYCGHPLPETGAYFVRQNNQKVASLCSDVCGAAWFYERARVQAVAQDKVAA